MTQEWPDRIERLCRALLWLVLSAVAVAVPIGVARTAASENDAREAMRAELDEAQSKLAEAMKPQGPDLLSLNTMGPVLHWVDPSRAEGHAVFTNVSQRSGVVCVVGTLSGEGDADAQSLPSCAEVDPFSTVSIVARFAGGDLASTCKKESCRVNFRDAEPAQ